MASAPPILSIPDVLQLLDEKQKHLENLLAQRELIQQQIDELDWEIQTAATVGRSPRKQRRRHLGKARLNNTAPLRHFVIGVLKKHKNGLRASEVTAKILEAGYRSHSDKFQNVVYQCLYNTSEIGHDPKTGRYFLKKD